MNATAGGRTHRNATTLCGWPAKSGDPRTWFLLGSGLAASYMVPGYGKVAIRSFAARSKCFSQAIVCGEAVPIEELSVISGG